MVVGTSAVDGRRAMTLTAHEAGARRGVADRTSEWIPHPRRVRVELGGETVADSKRMMLLRQHGFLPVLYFPEEDVRLDLLAESDWTTESPYKGTATYFDVRAGGRVAESAAWTYRNPKPGSPDTRGHYSFDWHSMDAWHEEDDRMFVHAKDPYLRVEALRSSRRVQAFVGGELVADTRRPVLVLETGLVTRYYIPKQDVRLDLLVPSDTFTLCPYKGRAAYYSVRVGDELHEDAIWYYRHPLRDLLKAENHLCFWQERDDTEILVDGEPVELPPVRQAGDGGELVGTRRNFFAVPPPASMAGAKPGSLQHDFSRPNRRCEGPPDHLIDMDVEAAGGRPGDWFPGTPAQPAAAAHPVDRSAMFGALPDAE
jgi:uncharacterized protein (DUF427 family)